VSERKQSKYARNKFWNKNTNEVRLFMFTSRYQIANNEPKVFSSNFLFRYILTVITAICDQRLSLKTPSEPEFRLIIGLLDSLLLSGLYSGYLFDSMFLLATSQCQSWIAVTPTSSVGRSRFGFSMPGISHAFFLIL